MNTDYYQGLNLPSTASQAEIKAAVQKKIQRIKIAYQTLCDADKRQAYDLQDHNEKNDYYQLLGVNKDSDQNQLRAAGQAQLDLLKNRYRKTQKIDHGHEWGYLPAQAKIPSDRTTNPYEVPQSDVALEQTGFTPYQLFSFGRIGRIRFIVYAFGMGFLIQILIATLYPLMMRLNSEILVWIPLITMVLFCLVCLAISLLLSIQRFHDFDFSGWWMLLFFLVIPIPFMLLLFLFKSGSQGENNYGLPCPPNTLMEKIAAGLVIPLIAAGLVISLFLFTIATARPPSFYGHIIT